jgi:hypothetical protein
VFDPRRDQLFTTVLERRIGGDPLDNREHKDASIPSLLRHTNERQEVTFEVLVAVTMKNTVFLEVTTYILIDMSTF